MASQLAKIVADFRTTLATEIAVGGTTGTLQSVTDSDGNTIPNGIYFLTLDGDGTQKEYIKCTVTGTALTNIRTINRQGTQASGTVRKHRIGAKVQITNFAHIKYMLDLLDGTTDFDSATPLAYDAVPTITSGMVETIATVDYVNGVALAGAPDAQTNVKGVVELATVAEQGTATATGSTGANLVPANANLVKTSTGAGDENKLAVLSAGGTFDQSLLNSDRTIGAVYSFTAARLLLTTDPATANEGTRKSYVDAGDLAGKFGDGSDGALAITSGTTTLNESTRDYYQYTSVSITDTGALAIGSNHQNKPVYIYVQGDLTVTSSATPAVDARGRGGAGGNGGSNATDGTEGSTGTSGSVFFISSSGNGGAGGATSGTDNSTGSGGGGGGSLMSNATSGGAGSNSGTGGTLGTRSFYSANAPISRQLDCFLGGGGGGGSGGRKAAGSNFRGSGGAGGAGGGCVIFIVRGNINITGTFNASGANGSNGGTGNGSSPAYGGGGGGGGGGGFIGIFYAGNVTANTATFTVSGGSAGTGGVDISGTGATGGVGANGTSLVRKIIASQL